MRLLIAIFLLCSYINSNAQVTKLWETKEIYKAPESVAYDSVRAFLYVSNFTGGVKDGSKYGNDCIVKANKNGEIIKSDWITNLTSPTGICISNDLLYITERFGIVVYDLKLDKIKTKYLIQHTSFLNDVTVDPDSVIYVTDSGSKTIYRIKSGKVEKWLDSTEIANSNGILYDDGKIIVGVGDNYLKSVNIATKEIKKIALLSEGGIDGIIKCGNDYLVSLFKGKIYLVKTTGEVQEILNTSETKTFSADFDYISHEGIIVVPALWNNKLFGYKYKK